MYFTVHRIDVLLAILMIALTGFGSALRIVMEPESIDKMTDNNLNVTCIADGPAYWAQTVMTIQILKQGQDKPIVTIDMKQKLTMGVHSDDNMKAEGHVDKDASKSFLTLVIQNPTMENAGTYRCQVFFFDENLQIKAENVFGNVTFRDPDVTDMVTNLMDKVSDLTKTVQKQEDVNLKQKDRIEMLEKQMVTFKEDQSECERNFDNLADIVKRQNETNLRQNQQLDELKDDYSKQLDILADIVKRQNETITVLREFINKSEHETTQGPCPDGWTLYEPDQTCLKVFGKFVHGNGRSWSQARKACQTFGGDLVQIRDKEKGGFIYKLFTHSHNAYPWIGIKNNAEVGSDYRYVDGSHLGSYHPWYEGFPKGQYKGHTDLCVYMYTSSNYPGDWRDDSDCLGIRPYVCSMAALIVTE